MSLKEFWHEEKQVRKQMRAERKRNKKQPKTTREKVYKILGIVFAIAILLFGTIRACSNLSGGYDWNVITGINNEIIEMLERDADTSIILKDFEITKESENSCYSKLASAGINITEISEDDNLIPTKTIELNSLEAGVIARDVLKDVFQENNYDVLALKVYSDTYDVYQKCVIKVRLSQYISNVNLPDIYITTTSVCEIQDERLSNLNYVTTINNLSVEESEKVLNVLNNNVITINFKKMATDNVNLALNMINSMFETTLDIASDRVGFIKK